MIHPALRRRLAAVALIAGLSLLPAPGIAQDLIVTASTAASVGPGRMLQADAPLALQSGESITLLGPDGPVEVAGPFEGSVGEAANLTRTAAASPLSDLVKRRERMKKLGAFRSITTGSEAQSETMFDLFADSAWCAAPGEVPTLYVAARSSDRVVTLRASDGTLTEILWPGGESLQPWPAAAPLTAGQTYETGISGVAIGAIEIKPGPSGTTSAEQIETLIAEGCMAQAETAISALSQ